MDLQNFIMNWGKDISGILALAVVNIDGSPIAGGSFDDTLDVMLPAAYFTEVVKSSRESFNVTGWGDFEDVLITSTTHYIVMRMINENVYFGAAVTIKDGNLGLLRLKMKKITSEILRLLG